MILEVQDRMLSLFLLKHGKHSWIQQVFLECWKTSGEARKTQVSDLRELRVQLGRQMIILHDQKCCDGEGTQDAVRAETRWGSTHCRLAVNVCGKNR